MYLDNRSPPLRRDAREVIFCLEYEMAQRTVYLSLARSQAGAAGDTSDANEQLLDDILGEDTYDVQSFIKNSR